MEIVNAVLLALLGLSIGVLSLFFVLVIGKNVRQGRGARRQMTERLESLRLANLLKSLGLDLSNYLHNEASYRICQNMDKCENCTSAAQCEQRLKQGSVTVQELEFCPNRESLAHFVELNQAAA
jgi:Tfp pilus assembly protein PilV